MFTKEAFSYLCSQNKITSIRVRTTCYLSASQSRIFVPVPVILLRHFYLHVDLQNKCLGIHLCNFFAEVQVFSLSVISGPDSPGVDIW